MKRAFLILVDGLRPDVAEGELAAGRLPHLARLTERGVEPTRLVSRTVRRALVEGPGGRA